MPTYRLDTDKLLAAVDVARGAGTQRQLSYRQVAQIIGANPSVFSRLRAGLCPDADALCSLLMWLDPNAALSKFVLLGSRIPHRARAS